MLTLTRLRPYAPGCDRPLSRNCTNLSAWQTIMHSNLPAKKLLQLLDSGRLRPSTYGLKLVRVSMYTTSFHYMAQVFYENLTQKHFCHLAYNFSLLNLSNTSRKSSKCYSLLGLKTKISSRYMVMQCSKSENDRFSRCWKVAGAFVKPIRITTYSYKPYGIKNSALCLSPSCMQTWW